MNIWIAWQPYLLMIVSKKFWFFKLGCVVYQNRERKKRILSSTTASADLPEGCRFRKWLLWIWQESLIGLSTKRLSIKMRQCHKKEYKPAADGRTISSSSQQKQNWKCLVCHKVESVLQQFLPNLISQQKLEVWPSTF